MNGIRESGGIGEGAPYATEEEAEAAVLKAFDAGMKMTTANYDEKIAHIEYIKRLPAASRTGTGTAKSKQFLAAMESASKAKAESVKSLGFGLNLEGKDPLVSGIKLDANGDVVLQNVMWRVIGGATLLVTGNVQGYAEKLTASKKTRDIPMRPSERLLLRTGDPDMAENALKKIEARLGTTIESIKFVGQKKADGSDAILTRGQLLENVRVSRQYHQTEMTAKIVAAQNDPMSFYTLHSKQYEEFAAQGLVPQIGGGGELVTTPLPNQPPIPEEAAPMDVIQQNTQALQDTGNAIYQQGEEIKALMRQYEIDADDVSPTSTR